MKKPSNITKPDWDLLTEKYGKKIEKVVKKIDNNYPIQYLIGNVDFYGYQIYVKKGVLIPRFETEGLVEKTLELIDKYDMLDANVLEVGTGTGCIPIVLKDKVKTLKITSLDINRKALKLARKNAFNYDAEINFIKKSVFSFRPFNRYSILISNPPYVSKDEEVGPEIKYEPKNAIFAKDNGLKYYKHILTKAKKWMKDEFIIAFEIGCNQGKELKAIAKENYPNAKIKVEKDLSNRDRYLFIINK